MMMTTRGLAEYWRASTSRQIGYMDITRTVHEAAAIFMDSGAPQKEACFHRVLCVTLRKETGRVETIEPGWNCLWTVPNYAAPRHGLKIVPTSRNPKRASFPKGWTAQLPPNGERLKPHEVR